LPRIKLNSINAAQVCDLWLHRDVLHAIKLLLLHGGAGGVNNFKNVDNCKRKERGELSVRLGCRP
jgi:hypothetical protein